MKLLAQTTRVARLSLFIALVPIVLVLSLAAATDNALMIVRICGLGKIILSWWWWVWAPTYLIAKALFLANCVKKNRSKVRKSAPWIIAINVALLAQAVSIALLGSYQM